MPSFWKGQVTVTLHTNTAVYVAVLVQSHEVPKAGWFSFKEKEIEAERSREVALVRGEVGPEL